MRLPSGWKMSDDGIGNPPLLKPNTERWWHEVNANHENS
jgi:hypothetical protein